jgi:hypothetical protein
MMLYRPIRIAPGVSPPTGMESDDTRRPTPPPTAALAPGDVTISDGDAVGWPHDEQKRLSAGSSAEHDEQRIAGLAMDDAM